MVLAVTSCADLNDQGGGLDGNIRVQLTQLDDLNTVSKDNPMINATIRWQSDGADTCKGTTDPQAWKSAVDKDSGVVQIPLTGQNDPKENFVIGIQCSRDNGAVVVNQKLTVAVKNVQNSVQPYFYASYDSLIRKVILSWNIPDATGCTASAKVLATQAPSYVWGGPKSNKSPSGGEEVGVTVQTQFTLVCTVNGATDSISATAGPPPVGGGSNGGTNASSKSASVAQPTINLEIDSGLVDPLQVEMVEMISIDTGLSVAKVSVQLNPTDCGFNAELPDLSGEYRLDLVSSTERRTIYSGSLPQSLAVTAPRVLHVGPQRSYLTVHDAIRDSLSGDVIEIDEGVYEEAAMVISHPWLTIRGSSPKVTIRAANTNGATPLISYSGQRLRVENFTVQTDGSSAKLIQATDRSVSMCDVTVN